MNGSVRSAALIGVEPRVVAVEAHISRTGQRAFLVVGLPDTAVREARDRVVAALASSGYHRPPGRTVVNLAPADLPKGGSAYDLPIALAVLAANDELPAREVGFVALGELTLRGAVRPARGALGAALLGRELGVPVLLDDAGAVEASVVSGADVRPVRSLSEAIATVSGTMPARPVQEVATCVDAPLPDLSAVRGQPVARRALEIAAAGGHHMLMWGPPGSGKSMLAQCLASILPPLDEAEALEVAQVFAAAGRERNPNRRPPFRSPHHTATQAAIVGGGSGLPTPGELSLAHRGVLFLDELAEFPGHVLEALRQPLEDGQIVVARQAGAVTFPSSVQVVAATNPCPCGFAGDRKVACSCTPRDRDRYARKLSGPLLDRLDVRVEVPRLTSDTLSEPPGEASAVVAVRVEAARKRQHARGVLNREMHRPGLDALPMAAKASAMLESAYDRLALSARGYDRIRRVARTIADLDESDVVADHHVGEALALRGVW